MFVATIITINLDYNIGAGVPATDVLSGLFISELITNENPNDELYVW